MKRFLYARVVGGCIVYHRYYVDVTAACKALADDAGVDPKEITDIWDAEGYVTYRIGAEVHNIRESEVF